MKRFFRDVYADISGVLLGEPFPQKGFPQINTYKTFLYKYSPYGEYSYRSYAPEHFKVLRGIVLIVTKLNQNLAVQPFF